MTSKWYGKIGFGETVEVKKGVWRAKVIEHDYYGNIINFSKRMQPQTSSTNDDLKINVKISIIADAYLTVHCAAIKYVEFMDSLWKIEEITPEGHRLTLTLGGAYNDNSDN